MSWNLPSLPTAGVTVATVANWATKVIDSLRYLKGLDGVPTIESGLTIDNTDGDERLLLPLLSTAECSTVLNAEGEVAFDEQTHRIKYYDNNSVVSVVGTDDVSSTPTDSATTVPISSDWAYDHLNILTTAGDIIYATGARTWARLGMGTAGQALRTNSGTTAPEWATGVVPTVVHKDSTETVNNSSTLQDDDVLLFAVGTAEQWVFEMVLFYTSGATPDIKFAITTPANTTLSWSLPPMVWGVTGTATIAGIITTSGADYPIQGDGGNHCVILKGSITTTDTAGDITLQWAQNTADVSDTSVLAGSYLIAHLV